MLFSIALKEGVSQLFVVGQTKEPHGGDADRATQGVFSPKFENPGHMVRIFRLPRCRPKCQLYERDRRDRVAGLFEAHHAHSLSRAAENGNGFELDANHLAL